MKLTGKVALITNVSHFMGPAITEEFCREGASVALHDRDEPAAIKPFAAIAERLGRDVLALGGDLTPLGGSRPRRWRRWSHASGGSTSSSTTARTRPPAARSSRSPTRRGARCMSRLLDEPFYCLRAALRVMRPAGRGKIINMSSAAAFPGLPNYAAYTAARAGVNGLTKAVGREVARDGIQVNAIAQNYVENPTYFPPALIARPAEARAHGPEHSGRPARAQRGVGPARGLPGLGGRRLLRGPGHPVRGRLGDAVIVYHVGDRRPRTTT